MLNFKFGKPVSYTMNVAPDGESQKITLEFRSTYSQSGFGIDLEGYSYLWNLAWFSSVGSHMG